jgi:hypothetical protein
MSLRRLANAVVAPLALAAAAGSAEAQVNYTFNGSFNFGTPITVDFVVQTPDYISTAGDYATQSCTTSDPGTQCAATMRFDPNGFSTMHAFIGLNTTGATAFYFFDFGAFLSDGTYQAVQGGLAGIDPTTGDPSTYGSAGPATLTVAGSVAAVPEPATVALMSTGLVAIGAAGARRRVRAG